MLKTSHFLFTLVCLVNLTATVHAASRIELPPTIREYEPFTANVWFSENRCSRNVTSVAGNVAMVGNELTIALSVSVPGNCPQPQKVNIPGLPRGNITLRVSATSPLPPAGALPSAGAGLAAPEQTYVFETVSTTIVVAPVTAETGYVTFWSGRFTPTSGAPFFLLTPTRGSMFSMQWEWLEVGDAFGDAYTFKGLSAPNVASALPDALSPLLRIEYPAPYSGSFFTNDATVAAQLARDWGRTATSEITLNQSALVGRATAAGCPLGMSPVFRLFNPKMIAHRWTQSRSLYTFLLVNGYSGEGVAWCAPALRGE